MLSVRCEGEKRKTLEDNKKRATSEQLKYLMIAVCYVHMVYSMLHVNAMRMDAKREHEQKNTKM